MAKKKSPKPKPANKGGRPRIEIDWDDFDKLCIIQCTLEEIALFFNCTQRTIENACKRDKKMGFFEYHTQKKAGGKISLRRKQYQTAMSGNVPLLIFLGKQYLDQSDKREIESKTGNPYEGITVQLIDHRGKPRSPVSIDSLPNQDEQNFNPDPNPAD